MDGTVLDLWNKDLAAVLHRKNRLWMRGVLRPRITVLPPSWSGYGAWTLLGRIFITRRQATCPDDVRRYLIAHELGHAWLGHVYLQVVFSTAVATFVFVSMTHVVVRGTALLVTLFAYACFIAPRWSLARECAADAVSIELYGPVMTLQSSVWMAQRTKGGDSPERHARLARLRAAVGTAAATTSG